MSKHFQKISGYKVVSKCRNCGKRVTGKTETYYCDDCLEKLRMWRLKEAEEQAAKAASALKEAADEAAKKEARKKAITAKKRTTKKKAAKKTVKKKAIKKKAAKSQT